MHEPDYKKLEEIYDNIKTEKNVITNADKITEQLDVFYKEILCRPHPENETKNPA